MLCTFRANCEPEHQLDEKSESGQTKRPLKFRVREHERSCEGDLIGIQPDENNDNGIPFHLYTTGRTFLVNQTQILAREKNAFRRKERMCQHNHREEN